MFSRARASLLRASREEKLELLRRSGALADHPRLGDKVVAHDMFGDPHFGVVVGVDREQGKWRVVSNGPTGVELTPLDVFASGGAIELVGRAPEGQEPAAVTAALELRGQAFDLREFRYPEPPRTNGEVGNLLVGLAAAAGLALAAHALQRDRSWDEDTGRYRDRRGRFAH
ncbi:MAG: hypothetical protein R3F61_25545 [Myxococcota bacterium]